MHDSCLSWIFRCVGSDQKSLGKVTPKFRMHYIDMIAHLELVCDHTPSGRVCYARICGATRNVSGLPAFFPATAGIP